MGDRQEQARATSRTEDDEQVVAHDAPEEEGGAQTQFRTVGGIPTVMGFPIASAAPSASDRAFGSISLDPNAPKKPIPPLVGQKAGDAEALAARQEAARLLKSKSVTSPQDAIAALELLNGVEQSHRGQAIDRLDEQAFENLIDRLPYVQRERLSLLVEASQDPKRKLKLWGAQHKARANNDLRRYEGTFEDPQTGEQTDEQSAAEKRHSRRQAGVTSTESEVDRETAALMAKQDLSVADIDAMRERKDKELSVEMKHNVNLIAESPLKDEKQVAWSTSELSQFDAALDKLPDEHVHDENSVGTYRRRANRYMDTRGGDYPGAEIGIYDNANRAPPGRDYVSPLGYTVTHEVGHEVATENTDAFDKFQKTAGWKSVSEQEVRNQGATDADMDEMHAPRTVGGKIFQRGEKDKYNQVDETAIPSHDETGTDRWKYALNDGGEHFAEMYAMAVQTPQLLYMDYVERPAQGVRALRAKLAEQRQSKAAAATIAETQRQLARADKIQSQRKQLYDIIRNDIFHADEGKRATVQRLKAQGVGADKIRAFEDKAAQVSTPAQLADLEREARQ